MGARGRTVSSSSRGGGLAAKRKAHAKTDRDGDLVMDSASRARPGGITKSKSSRTSDGASSKSAGWSVPSVSSRTRNDIQRHLASAARIAKATQDPLHRGTEELTVTGWKNSKASDSTDGGVSSLIAWLEKRATLKSYSKSTVRIIQSRVEADALIITLPTEHVGLLLRLNDYAFAGKNITIQRLSTKSDDPHRKENIEAILKRVLERRYKADTKLLDLSNLGQDEDLKSAAIFDQKSTTEKFFLALMKVFQRRYPSVAKFNEAVQSVSLAHNGLPNVAPVTTLAQFLPGLLNLDLSNNAIPSISALEAWKTRFSKLDHLLLTNNPIEQSEPDYAQTIVKWYRRLRNLNGIQVRSDEEASKNAQVPLPFPFRAPHFQDEGQIAESFIRNFFTGFDTDRTKLLNMYYDSQSDFSYSVNVSAPRDPTSNTVVHQEWGDLVKNSRNLNKITHLPARQSRHHRGQQSILDAWNKLPPTRHPDLAAEAQKWFIECQLQPGIPDPSGQSAGGVDGFLITVHGQVDELDSNTGQANIQRSFDRTIILGPGGPANCRVVNDMLVLRAYGGTQAFQASTESAPYESGFDINSIEGAPALPAGLTVQVAEQMVLELQKQTSMTIEYAKDCLEQVQWDMQRALQTFAAVRETLPPNAFVQPT